MGELTLRRSIVAPLITNTPRDIRRGMMLLRARLEERFRMYEENGDDWAGKPVSSSVHPRYYC